MKLRFEPTYEGYRVRQRGKPWFGPIVTNALVLYNRANWRSVPDCLVQIRELSATNVEIVGRETNASST